ncbi:membrane protein of unknown function [Prosthecochloris aestuarii DSM 271]|uniref:Phage holin family protein n=2 Tax=Chlorobiaceae TaxID=191412 RepID=B4S822_PROA2|nr:membrane protein of unknown function [Prosthecochloris aestuarii DSM 271]
MIHARPLLLAMKNITLHNEPLNEKTMANILLLWLINALSVYATASLLSGISVRSFGAALLVALVLGLINALLKPVLIFFSIPFIVVTLGLFLLIINALMLQLAAAIVGGFYVSSFGWAVLGSIVISIVSWLLSSLFNI